MLDVLRARLAGHDDAQRRVAQRPRAERPHDRRVEPAGEAQDRAFHAGALDLGLDPFGDCLGKLTHALLPKLL